MTRERQELQEEDKVSKEKKQEKDLTDLLRLSNMIWPGVYRHCLKSMCFIFSTYPDDDVKVSIEILVEYF